MRIEIVCLNGLQKFRTGISKNTEDLLYQLSQASCWYEKEIKTYII